MRDSAIEAYLANARPKVMAALIRYFGDLDRAEDACQDASVRALKSWPASGIPRDPVAWLVVAGQRAGIDAVRKDRRLVLHGETPEPEERHGDAEEAMLHALDRNELRDDVLRLTFMCCHPELSAPDQLALALKVIAGFSVEKIARAFVVKPKAMEQRITRAKKKAIGVVTRLETPTLRERASRLHAVSAMIYLMFNEGYTAAGGDVHIREELCEEAIRLCRLLLNLFPSQAELIGLLALFLLQHSRRKARIGADGALVVLEDQDRRLWDREAIREGQALLEKALCHGRPGPYQIQAAIAASHCLAHSADETDWVEIERLYKALEEVQPTPVVSLNRAVAMAKASSSEAALAYLDRLSDSLVNYIYFHATRASLLLDVNRPEEATAAYGRALLLGPTRQQAEHIRVRMAICEEQTKNHRGMSD
jgi:RNA polymerase sigma-70 factor, ECF subfamily